MSEQLSNTLAQLAACEQEMGAAEREVEIFRIKKTQALFAKRRALTGEIPQFWYVVLAENDDFAEYVRPDDLKYLDFVSDIYVDYSKDNESEIDAKDFAIVVTFKDDTGTVPNQTITKRFKTVIEDGEEVVTSEAVDVQWPAELQSICPAEIRRQKSGEYTPQQKKQYRQGMKSFFAWFEWTGTRPGKEFKSGEDLTLLIVHDVFPNAVKYYAEAVKKESDVDSSEGEELDVSDEEPEPKKQKKEI